MRGPGGRVIGRCTVVSVQVDEDGRGATWTIDTEDDGLPFMVRHGSVAGMSFALPTEGGPARDPLGPGELRIRWRESLPAGEAGQ